MPGPVGCTCLWGPDFSAAPPHLPNPLVPSPHPGRTRGSSLQVAPARQTPVPGWAVLRVDTPISEGPAGPLLPSGAPLRGAPPYTGSAPEAQCSVARANSPSCFLPGHTKREGLPRLVWRLPLEKPSCPWEAKPPSPPCEGGGVGEADELEGVEKGVRTSGPRRHSSPRSRRREVFPPPGPGFSEGLENAPEPGLCAWHAVGAD